jgi:cell wall-associated NlpC family hydrolase
MNARSKLVTEAFQWLNTPFKHNQCVKGIGADCIGVVRGVAASCGIQLPPIPMAYSMRPDGRLPLYLAKHLHATDEPLPGDVLLIAITDEPCHVAMYVGNDAIIHSYRKAKRCLWQSIDGWRSRIRGVYQFMELIDG